MDTKRNGSEEAKKQAGEKAKQEIDTWKPDVVITADDNAVQYVIIPYYKGSSIPFVFCGVNWDTSAYGFPWDNVTGMLEVAVVPPLLDAMGKVAKGKRVAFLGPDNETSRKDAEGITKKFNVQMTEKYAGTFDEWKAAFDEIQNQADMVIVINNAGIKGWNDDEAKKFTREHTRVPTGSAHDFVAPF